MFDVLFNGEYDSGCANQTTCKGRHQTLTRAMGLEAFDYSQSGSVEGRVLDCSQSIEIQWKRHEKD